MARVYERYLTSFVAQASAAITADTDSTGTQTDYDASVGGNLDGCDEGIVEIDVTSPPTTAASCDIFAEPLQFDGVGYANRVRLGSVAIETAANKYSIKVDIPSEKGKITIHAVGYNFTASANLRGVYAADT